MAINTTIADNHWNERMTFAVDAADCADGTKDKSKLVHHLAVSIVVRAAVNALDILYIDS